jgi:hypothetical protein
MDGWKRKFGLLLGATVTVAVLAVVLLPRDHFPERDLFNPSAPVNEQIAFAAIEEGQSNPGAWSVITGAPAQYMVSYEFLPQAEKASHRGMAYFDSELRKRGFGPKYSISSDTAVWTKGSRQILVSDFSKSPSPQSPSRVEVYDTNTSFGERLSFLLFKRR